jgi:hypothetical protein
MSAPPQGDFPTSDLPTLWSLPASAVPPKVGPMEVTPELRASYRGHEALLGYRARHPPHCYERFDQARLCWLSLLEPGACKRALEAYRPCAREMRKAKLAVYEDADAARRRQLNEGAKALAAGGSSGSSSSSSAAEGGR